MSNILDFTYPKNVKNMEKAFDKLVATLNELPDELLTYPMADALAAFKEKAPHWIGVVHLDLNYVDKVFTLTAYSILGIDDQENERKKFLTYETKQNHGLSILESSPIDKLVDITNDEMGDVVNSFSWIISSIYETMSLQGQVSWVVNGHIHTLTWLHQERIVTVTVDWNVLRQDYEAYIKPNLSTTPT